MKTTAHERALRVRRGTADDAAAVAEVEVASWRAAYRGLMPDAFLDAMSVADKAVAWSTSLSREESRGKGTLVVEEEGAVVGYATVGPDSDSDRGFLLLMYVLPRHWRRGCGRLLMQGTREALKDAGYEEAVLWVLEENAQARRFYEADGWRCDGATQVVEYGGSGLMAVRMVTQLGAVGV